MALRRIKKELDEINKDNQKIYSAGPTGSENFFDWEAKLTGPLGTPYEGGTFYLKIIFPSDYPFKPPNVSFLTPIYHCNVNKNGNICMDILKSEWSPALTISKVLLSISSLLSEPNPDDPLVPDIARLYKKNIKEHNNKAKLFTNKYALYKRINETS